MIATLFLVYYTVVNSDKINEARPVAVITEDDLDSNVIGLLPPNSKNKVKEVQNALNGIKDRDLDVVPVEENNAQEEFGYGDEKMYDDGDDEKENKPRGGNDNDMLQKDSNEASEKNVEEKILPPPDGSLTFQGPKNDRQKAVVDAFLHAWKGLV